MGLNAAQHFMNQATFHSTFPILVIAKNFDVDTNDFSSFVHTTYMYIQIQLEQENSIKNMYLSLNFVL